MTKNQPDRADTKPRPKLVYPTAEDGANGRESPAKGASSEMAYRKLRHDIISLTLAPGEVLEEAVLVRALGLSRTPVREAIIRLAAEGLLETLPNKGARVAPMGWNDIREHLEAFDMMQGLITRWAALRRTTAQLQTADSEAKAFERAYADGDSERMMESNWRFHAAIAACAGNGVLEGFYNRLLTENLRIARFAMMYEAYADTQHFRAHLQIILDEHRQMVEAIGTRNADGAEELGHSHARLAKKRVAEVLTGGLEPALMQRRSDPDDRR